MSNVSISNLPSVTSAQASSQVPAVQNGTTVYVTVDQIAKYTQQTYPITGITSITAQSPLSGGTITSSGTIGLTTGNLTNNYLANMPSNTIKGNNTGSSATPIDLTPSQVLSMIGAGTVSYVATGSGLSGGPITTTGTISIADTGVTSGTYGSATAVPQITINSQGQITTASRVNILIPTSQITGLGTMATQNANAVAITGGTINQTTIGATTAAAGTFTNLTATGTVAIGTISSGTWNGTPIAVTYGGTGATTASGARTNLGAAASGANSDITSLTGLTTPLAETEGGTGYGSYTTGDILYASSSSTLARLNDVATGNALISGGVGVAPSYGKIGLTTHVSGTLPVANGGTGATTLTGYLVGNGTSAVTAVSTIPNAGLTNSSITIGSTAISLGASTSTLAGLTTVTVTQDPTASLQLSTKQYVDNQVATVSNTTFHTASAAATTANLTATYNNGTAGVGATLTNSGVQAAFAVDGYTASLNDRILVKDQTTGAQNGIYTVTTVGTILTNWVLTRATDFNTVGTGPNYIETGASTFVNGGTTYGSTSWVMNTTGTITVGSTALVWVQTSSSGNITVSAPITKTGNTIGLGTVGVANGGTGLTSLTAYAVLYAASTSSVGQISPSTTGYPLLSTGASTAPAFGQLSLTAGVTGTLPVGNGGTGSATTFTTGSVVFAGASGVYSQNNAKFFWDNTNNRLGINTATPQTQLTIVSNTQTTTPTGTLPSGTDVYIVGANAANTRITQDAYGTGAYGVYTVRQARGTAASPTATQSGDTLAQFTGRGYGATVFATASTGRFDVTAAENFTDTAQGTYASVFTTATGANSPTEAFRFGPAGQFGIGAGTYGTSGQFLTSGGASAAPSWTTVSLSTLTGTVPVANGGTGLTSYTVGDLIYASASTTLSKLADVATGSVLVSGGVGVAPAWSTSPTVTALTTGSISNSGNTTNTGTGSRFLADFTNATITNRLAFQTSTTNSTTGIYALPNGTSTAASWQATNAADPTNASKILIATNGSTDVQLVSGINGTGTYLPLSFFTNGSGQFAINTSGAFGIGSVAGATVSYGTSGQLFVSGGSAAQPSWTSPTSIAVTSINFGTTGLTPSTATQGAVTVAGTLVAANGGTGQSSYTVGDLLYASSTTALSKLAAVASGSVLVSAGTGTAPAYSASPTLTTSLTTPLVIGGTAASSTLTLESTSGAGTTDAILFKIGSQSTALTINTSGNIIAGSGEASATPVGNPVRAPNGTGTNITGGNLSLYAGNGTGTGGSGYIDFQVAPVGTTGSTANTLASAMRITAAGNVGIGTTSPSTLLTVNGTATITTLNLTNALGVAYGGTGLSSTPTNGQIDIGNGTGFTRATLTAGAGITITNASGSVTVAGTGSTINSQTAGYTLVAGDAGKTISITTGGVTVPNSILSAGNIVTIYNNSGSSQTITQGTGVTLQWAGQTASTTGNRTLGLYGICTIIFISSSNAVISGSGLT
jgi:hypothetical protein